MSKRKREIQKRKKLAEEDVKDESLQTAESTTDVETGYDPDPGGTTAREPQRSRSPVDDRQIASPPVPAVKKKAAHKKKVSDPEPSRAAISNSWFGQNKENLLLGLLVFYVLLLGLGTMGELFEIEWILNLPLFK
jgi:hypothetical protein